MDEDFLETHDLDFYAYFKDGMLSHFTTAGKGFVPETVKSSINEYELAHDYVNSLSENTGFIIIDSNIPTFSTVAQRERYLASFSAMAKKGFFSYDYSNGYYKLIAAPQTGRCIHEIPKHIGATLASLSLTSSEDINLIKPHLFTKVIM